MADDTDSGEKTEKPTPKKLADARKKGQVPKSKDVTSTVVLLVWFMLGALVLGYAANRFIAFTEVPGRSGVETLFGSVAKISSGLRPCRSPASISSSRAAA